MHFPLQGDLTSTYIKYSLNEFVAGNTSEETSMFKPCYLDPNEQD